MPKAYSLNLRERVARFVDLGRSRRAASAHLKGAVSFVVNLMKAYRRTGSREPKPGGGGATRSLIRIAPFCRSVSRRITILMGPACFRVVMAALMILWNTSGTP